MKPVRVGIAGHMGSGKSEAADALKEFDPVIIDADAEAKSLMGESAELKSHLTRSFGSDILIGERIDFPVLGHRAFASRERLTALNRIVHPPLVQKLRQAVGRCGRPLCILDAALIPLWDIEDWFNVLLWIRAPYAVRLSRLKGSVSLSEEELTRRMDLQESMMPPPSSPPWSVVSNDGSLGQFHKCVRSTVEPGLSERGGNNE